MQIVSFAYLALLAAVVVSAYACHPGSPAKRTLLLLASYAFYAAIDWRLVLVLISITAVTYFSALALERSNVPRRRGVLLATVVAMLLLSLMVVRYAPDMASSWHAALSAIGLDPDTIIGEWLLPVGLSFYVFIAIGYLIEVQRRAVKAERDAIALALFLSFFPQLLAGPIARARGLLPQLHQLPRPDEQTTSWGVALLARGFAKKLILADAIGAGIVAPAFDDTSQASGALLLIAAFAYTVQIYFDLSGYTDIARGTAKLLGIELMENFDRPYLARSVSEFWQRWHISMSSFFRDYLYFSLGGSKRGNVYVNLVVTFLAIGLWHGVTWSFALYGLLHGSAVACERALRTHLPRFAPAGLLGLAYAFTFVVFSRVLFREEDLSGATEYLSRLLSPGAWSTGMGDIHVPTLWLTLAGLLLCFVPSAWITRASRAYFKSPPIVKAAGFVAIGYCSVVFSPTPSPFVYFRF